MGVLRWSPSDFWQASIADASEAYEGFAISKGIKQQAIQHRVPSEKERKALRAREEREKRKLNG